MSDSKISNIFKTNTGIDATSYTSEDIASRFTKTINNLNEILSVSNTKNGQPIYSVWIKFQLGEAEPILFDSQSDIYERNLIANLVMTKGQNGYANSFTLEIYYDIFKNGQETDKATAELLDSYIATAMSYDFSAETTDFLKGYIQYGYNQLDDTDKQLYTPIYEFYLTDANSEVNYNSGITHYSFQGISIISSDINFVANIEKQEDRPLTIVKNILTEYYSTGSSFDKPYEIDISETLLNEQPTKSIIVDAVTSNPLAYCKDILDANPLNQAEIDSGEYDTDQLSKTKESQKPQYLLYITEEIDHKVIHVDRVTKSTLGHTVTVDYVFDWSNTNNNIVTSWKPQADLKFYIIQYGSQKRYERQISELEKVQSDPSMSEAIVKFVGTQIDNLKNKIEIAKDDVLKEYYDATLECIGIPSDAPIGGIVRIKPVLFQSISRTAGIYFIKGAEDNINTNGTYKTILTLYRINGLDSWDEYKNINTEDEAINSNLNSNSQNSSSSSNTLDDTELWDHYKFDESGSHNPWRK